METDPFNNVTDNGEDGFDRYKSIIESVQGGIFILNLNGEIVYANDSFYSLFPCEPDELIGKPFNTIASLGQIQSKEIDNFDILISDIIEQKAQNKTFKFGIMQQSMCIVDFCVSFHVDDDGTKYLLGEVRDVTEREQNAEPTQKGQEMLVKLYEIGTKNDLTFEQKIERILAVGCEYLNLPYGFLTQVQEGTQKIVHAVGDHERLQPGGSAPIEQSYCRKTIKSDDLVNIQDAQAEFGNDDPAYERFELGCYIGTKILIEGNLYGTFCFAAPHDRNKEFTPGEKKAVRLLGQWAGYELEQQQFEDRLKGLHTGSQRLLAAETTTQVAEITINIITDIFDLNISAFWEHDADDNVLRPVAETDEAVQVVGKAPSLERGDALLWESFDSGEIKNYDDLTEQSKLYNSETQLRSEVCIPCGDHGIIVSASTERYAFNEVDIESLRLLEALVTEAIAAVKREEQLAERSVTLQQQNKRLEEFTGVVSHDLRSPLNRATGYLNLLKDEYDNEWIDKVDDALNRTKALINDLLTLASQGETIDEKTETSLTEVVQRAWESVPTDEATLVIDSNIGYIPADKSRLRQALENLFSNAVEHGDTMSEVRVGILVDDNGFYIEDNGSGFSFKDRKELFEHGYSTSDSGIGLGLTIVRRICEAHGWKIRAVDGQDGGARFEITDANTYL
jgi:PAS domain S-box-containing protein